MGLKQKKNPKILMKLEMVFIYTSFRPRLADGLQKKNTPQGTSLNSLPKDVKKICPNI